MAHHAQHVAPGGPLKMIFPGDPEGPAVMAMLAAMDHRDRLVLKGVSPLPDVHELRSAILLGHQALWPATTGMGTLTVEGLPEGHDALLVPLDALVHRDGRVEVGNGIVVLSCRDSGQLRAHWAASPSMRTAGQGEVDLARLLESREPQEFPLRWMTALGNRVQAGRLLSEIRDIGDTLFVLPRDVGKTLGERGAIRFSGIHRHHHLNDIQRGMDPRAIQKLYMLKHEWTLYDRCDMGLLGQIAHPRHREVMAMVDRITEVSISALHSCSHEHFYEHDDPAVCRRRQEAMLAMPGLAPLMMRSEFPRGTEALLTQQVMELRQRVDAGRPVGSLLRQMLGLGRGHLKAIATTPGMPIWEIARRLHDGKTMAEVLLGECPLDRMPQGRGQIDTLRDLTEALSFINGRMEEEDQGQPWSWKTRAWMKSWDSQAVLGDRGGLRHDGPADA